MTILRDRRIVLLALAAVAYSLAAWAVKPGFYDGFQPQQPYNWVSPPPQFTSNNQAPQAGHGSTKVVAGVVEPATIVTGDGQGSLSFIPGAFVTPSGGSQVTFDIKPVAQFPDPAGLHLATNAYCFTSTSPVASGKQVLITLRYSDQIPAPGDIYGYQDQGPWRRLGNTGSAQPYTVSVRVSLMGCFAGAYPANSAQTAQGARVGGSQTLPIVVALIIVIVVLAGVPLAVLRRRGESGAAGEDDHPSEEKPADEEPTRPPRRRT